MDPESRHKCKRVGDGMKDRVPKYPGKALITPENGSEAYYATIARADEPVEEGTPLNKATLLSDDAAHTLEVGEYEEPTPNDAFLNVRKPGDIRMSMRPSITDEWMLCNGATLDAAEYPLLADALGYSFVNRLELEGEIVIEVSSSITNYIRPSCVQCAFYDSENDVMYLLANPSRTPASSSSNSVVGTVYLLRAPGVETNLENYTVTYVQTNATETSAGAGARTMAIQKVQSSIVVLVYYNTGTTNSANKGFYKSVYDLNGNLTSYQYLTGFALYTLSPDLIVYAPEFDAEYPYLIGYKIYSSGDNLYHIFPVSNLLQSDAQVGRNIAESGTSVSNTGVKKAFYTRDTLLFLGKEYKSSNVNIRHITTMPTSNDTSPYFASNNYSTLLVTITGTESSVDVSTHLFEGNSASYLFVRASSTSCVVVVNSSTNITTDTEHHPYNVLGFDIYAMSYVNTTKYGLILVALLSDGNIYKISSETDILDPNTWEIIGKTDESMISSYDSCVKNTNTSNTIMLQNTQSDRTTSITLESIDGIAFTVGASVKLPELSADYTNYWIKVK